MPIAAKKSPPPKTAAPGLEPDDSSGMYLRSLTLSSFRSCYDTTVTFRPTLTLLVGENNSGKSNVIEALRLATVPLNLRRTRYFEADDRSRGRDGEAVEFDLELDGLTGIQQSLYLPALDITTGRALYKTRFRPDPDVPRRSQVSFHAGRDGGADAEPEKREQIRHVYLAPLRDAQRELDSASGSRLAFIIEQLTDPADREKFLAIANESLGTLAGHDVVTKTAGGIQDHVTALTEPVRGQDVRLGFEDYELRRLARGLRLKMAEHGIEPADLTESGLGYANLLFIATASWSSGTPTMPS
jgi:putative ATP-dependent endonuclease of OLD family